MHENNDAHYIYASPLGSRYWIPNIDPESIPYLGQEFDSIGDGERFYEHYGKMSGFSTHKSTVHKKRDGVITLRVMECVRSGKRYNVKVDTLNDIVKTNHRPSVKIGCNAGIRFRLNENGKYEVYSFENKHNHCMVPVSDSYLMRSNRKLNFAQQTMIRNASNVNIGPVIAHKFYKEMVVGFDNVGASKNEYKNYQRDLNLFIGDSDAQMVINTLNNRVSTVQNFSFYYSTDEEGHLENMFWADECDKLNYIAFGDVMSFDATFDTNKYRMILVPFTGINNHKRSISFGSALLFNETIESYKWLLQSFISTHGKHPVVVVTDQDPAMKVAVSQVLTESTHRLCMWHIMQKVTTKVGNSVCNAETGFLKRLQKLVWNEQLEPKEFESEWENLIMDYGLSDNKWLTDMYEIRDSWIPAFFRDISLSGLMKTTSRSEGVNNFFGKFTNRKATLVSFFHSYASAMDSQRNIQRTLDYEAQQKTPKLHTQMKLEKQLSSVLTHKLFDEFQDELLQSVFNCLCIGFTDTEKTKTYTVKDCESANHGKAVHQVSVYQDKLDLKCTCMYFERQGIICRHMFYVLRVSKIDSIPEHMLLRRWTKDVLLVERAKIETSLSRSTSQDTSNDAVISNIYADVSYAIRRLGHNGDAIRAYREQNHRLVMELTQGNADEEPSKKDTIEALLGVTQPEEIHVHAPKGIRNKGCGKSKRMISNREQAITQSSKTKRMCRLCKKMAHHDSRNCPEKSKDKEAVNETILDSDYD